MDIFDATRIPEAYKTHLPPETSDPQDEVKEVMVEPFIKVSQAIKDSLKRMYKLAALSADEAIAYKHEEDPSSFENLVGGLVGRIIALPIKAIKETGNMADDVMRTASSLRMPRGESGEWTEKQLEMAGKATMLTGAAIGGGMPGGGTGPANIGRKDALKMLAKDFRGITISQKEKETLKVMYTQLIGKEAAETEIAKLGSAIEGTGKVYRKITQAMHNVPQSKLDLIEGFKFLPSGRKALGTFGIESKEIGISLSQNPSQVSNTLSHEVIHAIQMKKSPNISTKTAEAHAYETAPRIVEAIKVKPKGQRLTTEDWDRIYGEGVEELWNSTLGKVKTLKKEIEVPFKPKEIFDSPAGKVKYDGWQEGFKEGSGWHAYTMQEGPAKGASFSAPTQKLEDVTKAANAVTENFSKFGKK